MADVGKIFVNYRRGDDPGMTGRLYDRLRAVFPAEALFMDVEGGITAGADFVDILREEIAKSDIVLVVIGRSWLTILDDQGRPRLENLKDFVRIEIEAAIEQGKYIIPVLVGGAAMPDAPQLPASLEPLTRRHAIRLTHERFQADCTGLVELLKGDLPKIALEIKKRKEAERIDLDVMRNACAIAEKRATDLLEIFAQLRDELSSVQNRSEIGFALDKAIARIAVLPRH